MKKVLLFTVAVLFALVAKGMIAQPSYMDGGMGFIIQVESDDALDGGGSSATEAIYGDESITPATCEQGVYKDSSTGNLFLRYQSPGGAPGDVWLSEITKLQIRTADGVTLTGALLDQLKNHYPNLNYLNLQNAAVENATTTAATNALKKLNEISQLKTIVFPAIDGLIIPAQTFKNNQTLETVIFPDLESGTYELYCEAFMGSKLKSVSLGKGFITQIETNPDSESGKFVFANCDSLSTVVLDDHIETLGEEMFYHTHGLKYLVLPDQLRKVGTLCFKESGLETVTIPDHLSIPTDAQIFQGCVYLRDIYVEADELQCGYQGLMEMNQTMNFSWIGGEGGAQTFSRSDYSANGKWSEAGSDWDGYSYTIPILHYVGTEKAKENYRTPAWLHFNGTNPEDGTTWPTAGDIGHKENGWSSLEWLQEQDPNITDIYQGYHGQHEWKAFTYPYSDYNGTYTGWRQFMIGGNTLKQQDIFYDNRVKEYRWYTICLPIDMTKAQFESAYGIGAALNEFSGANYDESKNLITLEFNTPATEDNKGNYLKRHVPYMIHPAKLNLTKRKVLENGTVVGEVQYKTVNGEIMTEEMIAVYGVRSDLLVKWDDRMDDNAISAVVAENEDSLSANKVTFNLTVSDKDFNMDYTFVGDYKGAELYGSTKTLGSADKIPEGAYYLGYTKDKYPLGFYYSSGRQNWVPYCAAILRKDNSSASAGAKVNFIDVDMYNTSKIDVTPTGIPTISIPVVRTDNKVYNLNGQVVRANAEDLNGLDKGIYIVGGKKIMVK